MTSWISAFRGLSDEEAFRYRRAQWTDRYTNEYLVYCAGQNKTSVNIGTVRGWHYRSARPYWTFSGSDSIFKRRHDAAKALRCAYLLDLALKLKGEKEYGPF